MPDGSEARTDSVGAWAKKQYLLSRALTEATLRPWSLGRTQWLVLWQLVHGGSTPQREMGRLLEIERATLSGIVGALVRKGLVSQEADTGDQRQRTLHLTDAGMALWAELPDPVAVATEVAFGGMDPADLAVARGVLQEATRRLTEHLAARTDSGTDA
ncbi:MarR family winged helix-turn-helix transcriptional regulator [uncultured Amnibacterium sp.]|uniref:MarR family winged helix-turn-helix transcriptional regulator n=1 Tax=uncultured Amnibacterium sp. TaxID=1631851 RepID=UPI0035C99B5C